MNSKPLAMELFETCHRRIELLPESALNMHTRLTRQNAALRLSLLRRRHAAPQCYMPRRPRRIVVEFPLTVLESKRHVSRPRCARPMRPSVTTMLRALFRIVLLPTLRRLRISAARACETVLTWLPDRPGRTPEGLATSRPPCRPELSCRSVLQ